jgi:CHAT domain-containing protein
MAEKAAPRSGTFLFILSKAAELAHARGDQEAFERYVARVSEVAEHVARTSPMIGGVHGLRGELALSQGKLGEAEEWFRKAIAVTERFRRLDESLAVAYRQLARLQHTRSQVPEAAESYRQAVSALEEVRVRLGGGGGGRLGFGVRHVDLYQEAIEALLEAGRPEEAFHYWERSRARALLEMIAERDLALDRELPAELRRRKRSVEAAYDRARRGALGTDKEAEQAALLERLGGLARQRDDATAELVRGSRRLASVAYPRPLDVTQAREILAPDTALLAYSVGKERTVLFVLAPAPSGTVANQVEALILPVGSERLRPRIAAWRRLAERTAPPPAFFAEAHALYDLLIKPAEPLIASVRRLVVCPDGPLHQVPFAALRRRRAYLVEWKSLTLVPSASVLGYLVQSRPDAAGAATLVAFGDPTTPGFPALTGSRREVAAITSLFPAARAFLGNEATKPRMEAAVAAVRYVHFAGHGVVNERHPLESALAFSPAAGETGPDSGLLHAWEVFERIRLDADLVTLSACRSAAGKELAGEGILGLTRAFHFAGARSVLASLWRVPDKSTPLFMRRFYGSLKRGLAKDEALRQAQLASIREGQHPVRWASFQLYGDWR